MDNFVNFLTVRNFDAQIYAFWDNAISNRSEQAKSKINELLERNMKRLLTSEYTKQAYRARLVEPQKYSELVLDNGKKKKIEELFSGPSGINGLPADKMGTPPSPTPGRANDEKMPCLYLASDVQTVCAEVQPRCEDIISVLEFSLASDMALIDLRHIPKEVSNYNSKEDIDKLVDMLFCQSLLYFFSRPANLRNDQDYACSQYASKYFFSKQVDGILYNSSHNYNSDAYNIVLFNPEKATPKAEYGDAFRCLSVQTTFQNISKSYTSHEKIDILEAKREEEPLRWNIIALLQKELTEIQNAAIQERRK